MRSNVIRLKKALLRLAAACPTTPVWVPILEGLHVPEKGAPCPFFLRGLPKSITPIEGLGSSR